MHFSHFCILGQRVKSSDDPHCFLVEKHSGPRWGSSSSSRAGLPCVLAAARLEGRQRTQCLGFQTVELGDSRGPSMPAILPTISPAVYQHMGCPDSVPTQIPWLLPPHPSRMLRMTRPRPWSQTELALPVPESHDICDTCLVLLPLLQDVSREPGTRRLG